MESLNSVRVQKSATSSSNNLQIRCNKVAKTLHFPCYSCIVAENLLVCSGGYWGTSLMDGATYKEELSHDSETGALSGIAPPILHSTHPAYWKPQQSLFTGTGGDK